jgi:DNA-binding XRE family transcriptional regulator
LALAGAALAAAIYNGSEYDRWKTANDSLRRAMLAQELALTEQARRAKENNQLMDSIQTRRKVAIGLGITGALVTAGGVLLLFTDSAAAERNGSSSWFRKIAAGMTIDGAMHSGEIAWHGAW